jgi:hypothetical protein
VDSTHFSLDGSTGNGTYTSGGTATGVAKTGTLLLGAGTYTLNATQNPTAGWRIAGAVGGGPPAGLSAAKWGTRFVLGAGVGTAFKFNDVWTTKFENLQIDCNSQSASVGISYTADGVGGLQSSQNEFTNFGVYNCQYAFQIGLPVTQAGNSYQMDQMTVRRFQIVSPVAGAEGFTFNSANAAQAAIFEEGSIQKVNIGFDAKYYGGLGQWKRIVFGGLANWGATSISGASNASPIVITQANHPYVTNDYVYIAGVGGNTAANGTWQVTRVDANSFQLNGSTGNGAYQSSTGTAQRAITGATNASPIVVTEVNHGYVTGQRVQIAGVGGNTAANANWYITLVDANSFSLNGSTGNGSYTSGGTSARMATAYSLTSSADYWIEDSQSESGARETFLTVTGASTATGGQIELTVTGHGYQTGDIVNVLGVTCTSCTTPANSLWQISVIDSGHFYLANSAVGGGTPSASGSCSFTDNFHYTSGPCVQRMDVNFINANGSPYSGGGITLLHNIFDEPVVVNRVARITSIDNYGPAPAVCLAGSNCRVVSTNDRFTNPGPLTGWDTSASGQVLRLGGGDSGADVVSITSPASITGAGMFSTTNMAAAVNPSTGSGFPTETWTVDLSKGNTQQFVCGQGNATVNVSNPTNLVKGELVTLIFVQYNGTACTLNWTNATHIHGGMTPSTTANSVNVQEFIVSNNGSELYAITAGTSCTTSCGTP